MGAPHPRVLVCDDEPDIRMVVGLNLDLAGMEFVEAGGGAEALELLRSEEWDALVLDLMMPGVDGFAVLHGMTEESLAQEAAVVVLSAKGSPQAAIEAMRIRAHSYLTKPFSPVAVAQVLEELIAMSSDERDQRRNEAIERAGALDRMGLPSV